MKLSLRHRLSIILVVNYAVLASIVLLVTLKAADEVLDRYVALHGNAMVSALASLVTPYIAQRDYQQLNEFADHVITQPEIAGILIQGLDGSHLASKGICTPSKVIRDFNCSIIDKKTNGRLENMAALHIFINKKFIYSDSNLLKTKVLAALFLAFAFCCIWLIMAINKHLHSPLSQLIQGAKKLSDGDLDTRLTEPNMSAELAELAKAFEKIADSLREQVEKRIKIEQGLVQEKKMTMLGELSSMLLHEVGGSMNRLFMILFQLKQHKLDEKAMAALEELDEELNNLNRFARNISLFSKKQELKIKSVSLNDLLKGMIASFRLMLKKEIEISLNTPDVPVLVMADAEMLQRALANIIKNSVDACPEKDGRVSVTLATQNKMTNVVISDNGPGIPPEHIDKIFEPFFSTKGTGTGLGLAIAKSFIEAHGGVISVNSSRAGTTFTIKLPSIEAHKQ